MKNHLNLFLSNPNPTPLTTMEARELEQHLVECDYCATKVAESELHREALLDSLRLDPDAPHEKTPAIEKAQEEIEIWARRIMLTLSPEVRGQLSKTPTAVERAQLRTLGALDPATYRTALALSEALLVLRSFILRGSRTSLDNKGTIAFHGQQGNREIDPSYVAARIADHAGISIHAGGALWSAIANLAVIGHVGLPDLAEVDRNAESVVLSIADEGRR
jgi:hypothetical protein